MDTTRSTHNVARQISRRLLLPENVAIRLYTAVNRNTARLGTAPSLLSICSTNDLGHSCRICRWNRNELSIQQCPCECKGSVGYVHLKCLRRWIIHRGDDTCEICGTRFQLSPEKLNYKKLFWSFFEWKYLGAIFKNCVHLVSLAPISYVVLYQVLQIMDNLQLEDEHNNLEILVLAPALLLTSSMIFFHILEFAISRCLNLKNIIKHWWNFGGQDTDSVDIEIPSELFEFF